MKKESIIGFVVWLLIFGIAVVFGFVFLSRYAQHSILRGFTFVAFFAGAIVAGLLFNSILFEIAHVIGALIGGYKVTSVNILGLCFYKENNKIHFGFRKYDGLTGETKIIPIEEKEGKQNPILYSLMGCILFGIEFVVIIFVFIMFKDTGKESPSPLADLAYFLMTFMVVGLVILLYNIVPFKLDSMTDGYRLRLISNKNNKNAYNDYLLSEAGMEIKPRKDKKETNKENVFSDDIKLNTVYKMLDEDNYIEAVNAVDEILNDKEKINSKLFLRSKAQKAYIILLTQPIEQSKEFYDKEFDLKERKEISEDGSLPCIRTYVLMSGLLDKSESECLYVLKRANKAYKHVPLGMKKIETKLYNKAIEKVLEVHPNWSIGEYKINEEIKTSD